MDDAQLTQPYEQLISLLPSDELAARARKWLVFMLERVDYWHAGGIVHLREHWARVLVHALVIGAHEGIDDCDLEALCATAMFHDTRRKNAMYDTGHGARAAKHYRAACERDDVEFDARAWLTMAFHDRDDAVGLAAIATWGAKHGYDDAWIERAQLLYRIFKDADALDRPRVGPGYFDARYLRIPFSKEQIDFALELLDTLPSPPYKAAERGKQASWPARAWKLNPTASKPRASEGKAVAPAVVDGMLEQLASAIDQADAIAIGIGSGLSTASGYDVLHGSDLFDYAFTSFEDAHDYWTFFDGIHHTYATDEQRAAFFVALADFLEDIHLGAQYVKLAQVLQNKQFFVLTTNVDGQVPRAFGENDVWLMRGDARMFQCSADCCDRLYRIGDLAPDLLGSIEMAPDKTPQLPRALIPRCPDCKTPLTLWVDGDHFVESELWRTQKATWESFIEQHLTADETVLFLELCVGDMARDAITKPFQEIVANNPRALYASVNRKHREVPDQLGERALVITADVTYVLAHLADKCAEV